MDEILTLFRLHHPDLTGDKVGDVDRNDFKSMVANLKKMKNARGRQD